MISSPLMTVMVDAARKAARSLRRDFGEVENLQVSRKGPGISCRPPTGRPRKWCVTPS